MLHVDQEWVEAGTYAWGPSFSYVKCAESTLAMSMVQMFPCLTS